MHSRLLHFFLSYSPLLGLLLCIASGVGHLGEAAPTLDSPLSLLPVSVLCGHNPRSRFAEEKAEAAFAAWCFWR
ncbi:hypothetical protein U1Q18_033375 [Sarracenia purpurea var. burkii]